jgi:hypothetical protein
LQRQTVGRARKFRGICYVFEDLIAVGFVTPLQGYVCC